VDSKGNFDASPATRKLRRLAGNAVHSHQLRPVSTRQSQFVRIAVTPLQLGTVGEGRGPGPGRSLKNNWELQAYTC